MNTAAVLREVARLKSARHPLPAPIVAALADLDTINDALTQARAAKDSATAEAQKAALCGGLSDDIVSTSAIATHRVTLLERALVAAMHAVYSLAVEAGLIAPRQRRAPMPTAYAAAP